MIMYLLGLIDALIGIDLILMIFKISLIKNLPIIFGIYLIAKGAAFIKSFASIIDILVGIVLIINYFTVIPNQILIISAILMLQKGIFSFF